MEIIRLVVLIPLLTVMGCHATNLEDAPTKAREWRFNFFTPKALPALVTFVAILDINQIDYRFNTLDSTASLDKVIGKWNDQSRAPGGHWNRIKAPPKLMIFCWDSIIDKRVYETHISFPQSIQDKMSRPSELTDYVGNTAYYDTVQIGLAPEGKVAVWLRGIGTEPNYRVTPSTLKTLTGENLEICKGITKHPNGYKYYGETPDFIKGKTYPYGNW
ncbi:DUF2931 family protein [Ewingella allii]|uniref:DUF2931 family protein n=1 Tax=Ewingella allii TaxID=3092550 RepID=UPI003796EF7C